MKITAYIVVKGNQVLSNYWDIGEELSRFEDAETAEPEVTADIKHAKWLAKLYGGEVKQVTLIPRKVKE